MESSSQTLLGFGIIEAENKDIITTFNMISVESDPNKWEISINCKL